MVYDASDGVCETVAKNFADKYKFGSWSVSIEGVNNVLEMNNVLMDYCNIKRLTFETHGNPGNIYFGGNRLNLTRLTEIIVPPQLFDRKGQLLFLGCSVARGYEGEKFLTAAGKRFFAGKGGVVGGSTIRTLGYSWGVVLPYGQISWSGLENGILRIFDLDNRGYIIGRKLLR